MIDEKYINLVTAYLDNSITSKERIQLNKLIDKGEIDIHDLYRDGNHVQQTRYYAYV